MERSVVVKGTAGYCGGDLGLFRRVNEQKTHNSCGMP